MVAEKRVPRGAGWGAGAAKGEVIGNWTGTKVVGAEVLVEVAELGKAGAL